MPRHTIALASIATFATACDQRRLAATGDVQADRSEDRASVIRTDSNGTSIRGATARLTGNDCIIICDDCLAAEAAGAFCGTTDTCTDNAAFAVDSDDSDDGLIDAAAVGDDLGCGG